VTEEVREEETAPAQPEADHVESRDGQGPAPDGGGGVRREPTAEFTAREEEGEQPVDVDRVKRELAALWPEQYEKR
jgi:hypothetical protein